MAENIASLQDMCELANASKNAKIFITMVAHKSIKEYGKFLSVEIINSFTGIEGRIKEVLFVTSSKNNYELIQNAIEKDEAFETVHQTMRYLLLRNLFPSHDEENSLLPEILCPSEPGHKALRNTPAFPLPEISAA